MQVDIQRKIRVNEFSYNLPETRIAKYPLPCRDDAKLLLLRDQCISEDVFANIEKYIPAQSQIVRNNTKVICARLLFEKPTGAIIEIFCLSPHEPFDYQKALSTTGSCIWKCMVGNLKKWKSGLLLMHISSTNEELTITAEKVGFEGNDILVRFDWKADLSFGEIINRSGIIPIPPYLRRESENIDKERYQTIYSAVEGSVAAPTAGLHFTGDVIRKLQKKDIAFHDVTLHVGAGTFQPVKTIFAEEHEMHEEYFYVNAQTIKNLAENKHPVIATGTTSLRVLESLYWIGVKSYCTKSLVTAVDQWEYMKAYPQPDSKDVFHLLHKMLLEEKIDVLRACTKIMIVPGYSFKVADALITNFHMPRSTLMLLVAAFTGHSWKSIYQYALDNRFRFLSYGDSSLLWR